MAERTKGRLTSVVRVLFLALGAIVIVALVRGAGPGELLRAISEAMPWLPVLLLLDMGRILSDTTATYLAYGPCAALVPRGQLVRAHVIANAVTVIAPMGRTAAEATKAALLSPWVGWPRATAAATLMQSLALLAGAVVTIPCAVAAWALAGPSLVTLAIVVQGVGVAAMGLGIRAGSRNDRVGRLFSKRGEKLHAATAEFQQASRAGALVPTGPLAALVLGRTCQIAQYYVLVHAVGGATTIPRALVAQGVNMVGLAVGVLVPGQLGATDGAFALSSHAMSMTEAQALAVPLLVHALQAVWIAVGALTPMMWRPSAVAQSGSRSMLRSEHD